MGFDFYKTMRWCYFCRDMTPQKRVLQNPWNWREARKMGDWECKNDHSWIPSYRALYTKDENIIYMRDSRWNGSKGCFEMINRSEEE